jgi:hypothetical protein
MRAAGEDRYVWTTGSWLLYSYLKQASKAQSGQMEAAIARGDITWHALPFTWQSELLDRSAISGCLGFSTALDKRFDRRTTGAKMTDVPGHTRGLVISESIQPARRPMFRRSSSGRMRMASTWW